MIKRIQSSFGGTTGYLDVVSDVVPVLEAYSFKNISGNHYRMDLSLLGGDGSVARTYHFICEKSPELFFADAAIMPVTRGMRFLAKQKRGGDGQGRACDLFFNFKGK